MANNKTGDAVVHGIGNFLGAVIDTIVGNPGGSSNSPGNGSSSSGGKSSGNSGCKK